MLRDSVLYLGTYIIFESINLENLKMTRQSELWSTQEYTYK